MLWIKCYKYRQNELWVMAVQEYERLSHLTERGNIQQE